jgi:glycosyltransferase involved in cell wall biosynthesis
MQRLGWATTVITVNNGSGDASEENWHGIRIVRHAPHSLRWRITQLIAGLREADHSGPLHKAISKMMLPVAVGLSFPDTYTSATRELVELARTHHKQQPFDLVLSLYHPLTSHSIAEQFSRENGLPWVAMTKDFFSWPDSLLSKGRWHPVNSMKRRLERRALQNAASLVTISEYMSDYLQPIVPQIPVRTLPHCFDPELYPPNRTTAPVDDVFRLVSVGRSLRKHDSVGLSMLFDAVHALDAGGRITPERFRLCFVGSGAAFVKSLSKTHDCEQYVDFVAPQIHEDAMAVMSAATCLLYIQTPFGTRRRFSEYVGARRPILALPEFPGTMSDSFLRAYGAGRVASDSAQLTETLADLIEQHASQGRLELPFNQVDVEAHSAVRRAEELSELLQQYLPNYSPATDICAASAG